MYIAILWRGNFPHGMALNNRFIAFAKGLIEHGESVVVLSMTPATPEKAPADLSLHGTYQGIEYVYTSADLFVARSRWHRVLQRLGGFARGLKEIWHRRRRNQLDVMFFPGFPSWQMAIILLLGRLLRVKVVHERNEHPFLEAEGRWLRKLERLFYICVLIRYCDGVEVISTPLERLFRPHMGKRSKMLVAPAIVEISRFEYGQSADAPPVEGAYIAWCGSVWGEKDGVPQLVEAFTMIAKQHPQTKLVLIAPKDGSADYKRVLNMIRGCDFSVRIVVAGEVSQAEMPRYLGNATVLALARPSSLQAEYGFPTKLPEYLATGRPVLATRVGDIPRYLKDGENAYLVDPDDTKGFAEKLDYILKDLDKASKVGVQGKILAKTAFSSKFHAGRLAAFFRDLP